MELLRWSNIELEDRMRNGGGNNEWSLNLCERSEVPSGIDPSMVAVWSQFIDYEATVPELSLNDATQTPTVVRNRQGSLIAPYEIICTISSSQDQKLDLYLAEL